MPVGLTWSKFCGFRYGYNESNGLRKYFEAYSTTAQFSCSISLDSLPQLSHSFFFIPVSIFRSLTPDVILVFHSILFCSIRDCFSNSSNHFKVNNIIKSVVVIYRTRNKSINNVFNGICSFGIVTSATPNCVLEQRLIAFIANIGNARTI